ncbi:MAG TPA: hypothetical protein ENK11_02125 [Phycisphaerales bacterium]|nr:hypothetical protein [Phycisphaerales bacterium]
MHPAEEREPGDRGTGQCEFSTQTTACRIRGNRPETDRDEKYGEQARPDQETSNFFPTADEPGNEDLDGRNGEDDGEGEIVGPDGRVGIARRREKPTGFGHEHRNGGPDLEHAGKCPHERKKKSDREADMSGTDITD